MALTPKQKLFVQEYLKDKNATRSAKAAGFSKKTAHSSGPRLLDNVGVQKAIEAGLAKQLQRVALTGDMIIAEIQQLGFQKLNKNEMKKVSTNKLKALELLGKHFKLFTDVSENKSLVVSTENVDPAKAAEIYKKIKEDC